MEEKFTQCIHVLFGEKATRILRFWKRYEKLFRAGVLAVLCVWLSVWTFRVLLTNLTEPMQLSVLGEQPAREQIIKTTVLDDDSEVTRVHISWLKGSVTVCAYNGAQVKVEAKAAQKMPEGQEGFLCTLSGRLVNVEWDDSLLLLDKGFGNTAPRDVVVYLPLAMADQLTEVEISAHAADVMLKNLNVEQTVDITTGAGEIRLQRVSAGLLQMKTEDGNVTGDNVNGTSLKAQTTAGEITLKGSTFVTAELSAVGKEIFYGGRCEYVTASTVRGDITVQLKRNAPKGLQLTSYEGDIAVLMREPKGFLLHCDKPLTSDFPLGKFENTVAVYGDGSALYEIDSVYGDILLQSPNT